MHATHDHTFDALASSLLTPIAALASLQEGITISDPRTPDNPVVYANDSFLRLTGYVLDEVVGRNCRFLQGPDTDPQAVARIHKALQQGEPLTIELLNYRRDGSAFWNQLTISPIRDASGMIINFVAIQRDVTAYSALRGQLTEKDMSIASLNEALQMLRARVQEQEETIAAFIMQANLDDSPGQ